MLLLSVLKKDKSSRALSNMVLGWELHSHSHQSSHVIETSPTTYPCLLTVVIHPHLSFTCTIMANRDGSRKSKGKGRADEGMGIQNASSDNSNIATYMARLSVEQRDTISEFIEATKEPVSVAIRTLLETEWDLLDTISRFGDDTEQDDKDTTDPTAPVIESIRPRSTPGPTRRSHATDKATLRFLALLNATNQNGIEFPRSQKSVLLDPLSLDYSLLPSDTPSIPMFISPYDEKMWYTGFMQP